MEISRTRSLASVVVTVLAVLLAINDLGTGVNAVPLTERLHRRTRQQHHTLRHAAKRAIVVNSGEAQEEVARDAELFELHSVEGQSSVSAADRELQRQFEALQTMSGAGGSDESKVASPDFTILNWNVRYWGGRLGVGQIAPLDAPASYKPLKLWEVDNKCLGTQQSAEASVRGHPAVHARLEHDLTTILTLFSTTREAGVLVLQEAYYMYELIAKLIDVRGFSKAMYIAHPPFANSPIQSKAANAFMYVGIVVIAKAGLKVTCASTRGLDRYALCTVEGAQTHISAHNPPKWTFGAVHLRANMKGDVNAASHANELSCVLPGSSVVVGDMNDDPASLQVALNDQTAAAIAKQQAASSSAPPPAAPQQSVALTEQRKRRLSESAESACTLAVADDTSASVVEAERKAADAPTSMTPDQVARANANRDKAMKMLAEKEKAKAAANAAAQQQAELQQAVEWAAPRVIADLTHGTHRNGARSAGFGHTFDFAIVNTPASTTLPVGHVQVQAITDIDHDSDHQPISVHIFWPQS